MKSIQPRQYVATGTSAWEMLAFLAVLLVWPAAIIVLAVVTWGIGIVIWGIKAYLDNRKMQARLQGSALKVGPYQFPEIHRLSQELAEAMQLKTAPDIYVLESNEQNAFAMKHGKKASVVLVDDLVHGALSTENPNVLNWLVAHEVAHLALGHTAPLRRWMRSICPPLSRLDEISCDRVAAAVVDDPTAVRDALVLLLIGPQLFRRVDQRGLELQAKQLLSSKRALKAAESGMTHPLLVNRYALATQTLPPLKPQTLKAASVGDAFHSAAALKPSGSLTDTLKH